MKLPDFLKFPPFNLLREKMGASLVEDYSVEFSSDRLTLADLEEMSTVGKDIILEELRVLEDGTLAYKDSRVLLYIRDVGVYHNREPEENLPKFHLADCRTLKMMRDQNRFERYVVSIRTDGLFDVNFIRRNKTREQKVGLQVCMNCLDTLSYKGVPGLGYGFKRKVRDEFSIDEYFSLYPRSLFSKKPKYSSASAPLNQYPSNWDEISMRHKVANKYICEACAVDLSDKQYKKFLHVHHKNGQKNDCSEKNLMCLCLYCHAEEYMHAHLKNTEDYKRFLSVRPSLVSQKELANSAGFYAASNANFSIDPFTLAVGIASKHGVKFVDFRSKGGAFWIETQKDKGEIAEDLKPLGFRFKKGRGWWKAK